jgi:putative transposase
MAERLKDIHVSVAKAFEIEIIEQEVVSDHVHILFASKPKIQISKFINSLKSVSGKLIFREFPEIKDQLCQNHLWSASYFIASAGEVTLDVLKKYVEGQNVKNL